MSGFGRLADGDFCTGGKGCVEGGLEFVEDAAFGKRIDVRSEIGGGGDFAAVKSCEFLLDLRNAAVTMHVAEAADVHENVKPEGGSGVKGAECFVVPAAVAKAHLDDFGDTRIR